MPVLPNAGSFESTSSFTSGLMKLRPQTSHIIKSAAIATVLCQLEMEKAAIFFFFSF